MKTNNSSKPSLSPLLKSLDYEDLLTNYVEDSFVIVDTDLIIVSIGANFRKQYLEIFKKEVLIGESILNYTAAERREIVRGFYTQALNGEIVENEVDFPISQNTILNCRNKYKPFYNREKQIVGIFVSAFNTTSIRKAESESRKNEDKYRLFVDNSLDAFLFGTLEGDVMEANDAAVEMFGYTKEEFKKLNRHDFIDHSGEQVSNYVKEREKNGKMKGELIGIRKNGERFPFEVSSVTYKETDEQFRVGAFISDISARKKAEKLVESSEKRFRVLVENSSDLLILSDENGLVKYVSPSFERITGFSFEDTQNQPDLLASSLHPDFRESVVKSQREAIEKPGVPIPRQMRVKRKDGQYLWLEGFITNLLNDGSVEAIVSNYRDISERKAAEDELIKSENRFRALVEKGEDIIIMTNPDGTIIYVSPAFEKLTGYDLSEVAGQRNMMFMHQEQADETKDIFDYLIKHPGLSLPGLNRIKCKNGEYKWIEGYITNLLHDESVQAIISNYLDITERKKASELIRQSESDLKTIFENTSEAFLLIDENGLVKAFNNKVVKYDVLNAKNKIKVGKHILSLVLKERRKIFKGMLAKAATGETIQYDHLYEKGDHKLWVDLTIRPLVEENQLKGYCITGKDITARKEAEQEVARRELRFRSILENSHDILFIFNAEGEIEFLSPVIHKLFGYTDSQNEIPNILDNIQPDDLENVMISLKRAFSSPGIPVYTTLRKRRKDGVYIWLEGTLTNMLHVPQLKTIVANFRDITERKIFEEQQEFMVSIINTSDDAILSIDTNKTILSWNHGAEKMFGYTDTEVIGKSIFLIIPLNRWHEEDEILRRIYTGVTVNHLETKRLTKYGSLIDVSLTVSLIKDNKGNISGVSKIIRNISDKKKAEEIITNNEKRFRSLLQNSNDGLSLLGLDGVTLEISQTGKKILGFDDNEMIGYARYDLIHPDDLELVSQAFVDVIEDPEKTRYFEYRSLCKDGNYKWLEASCLNLLNEPAVGAIVVNFRDISIRKSQEIEREQLIRTLNQNNSDLRNFSYIISHNLRAPLSNLMGFIDLLKDIPIENYMLKDIIEGFGTSTIQLDNTVNDLIKTLVIRDNNSIEQREVEFDKIFAQVKSQLTNLIQEAGPEIEVGFNLAPSVVFRETYLESILMNLMTNAIKYRDHNRKLRIKVETKKANEAIIMTFTDNGIGFDVEKQKEKVFGLYQRFHDYPNSKGLGLFLIKSQIESLGGSIYVHSTIDVGTTFTLKFKAPGRDT